MNGICDGKPSPSLYHTSIPFPTFQKEQDERPALSQPQLLLASCLFPSILKVAFPPFFFCVVQHSWMPSSAMCQSECFSTQQHPTPPSNIQQHPTPSNMQHHPAASNSTQQHPTPPSNIQHHPTPSNTIQQHPATSNTTQQHPTPPSNIQHHPTPL